MARGRKSKGGWFDGANLRLRLIDLWTRFKDVLLHKSKKQARDYFESATLHCYSYIVDNTMTKYERRGWRILHVVSSVVAAWVMWVAGSDAILTPVGVYRVPVDAPLTEVPHPAVAICALNRISKSKANQLAENLVKEKNLNYTVDEVIYLLGYLGLAYDLDIPNSDQLDELHDIMYPYNLDHVMKELTPSCEETITRCLWRGEIVKCSDYFSMRKTMEGYCCTFNYLKDSDLFSTNTTNSSQSTLMAMPGLKRGLSVVMDPHLDDYLFTRYPHEGMKILVFNSDDYPDITSGGCMQQNLAPRTELYVNLESTLLTATDDVKELPISTRECLSPDDKKKQALDSYSDCIVSCRIKNIAATCGCTPFFVPSLFDDDVCNLKDNVCLKKWKENWWAAWSGEELLLRPGQIAGDVRGPPCDNCIPSCEESSYKARQHSLEIQVDSLNSQADEERSPLKKNIVFTDHCIVHIYFSKDSVLHLEYGLLSMWYNLLSNMGGICGLFLGGSLISIVEFLYYVVGGPATKSRHRHRADMRQLYWEELKNYKRR